MKTSYSALDTFLQCPLKYKFQEIDKIRAPKGKDAIFGTAIHSALKFYHQPGRLSPVSEKEVLNFFVSNWKKELFEDEFAEQTLFSQGKQILEKYAKQNDSSKISPIALELYFQAPMNENHSLSGKIDRIDKLEDGSFEIIDYKTSRRLPSQENIENDLQLAIYQIGFLSQWPDFDKNPIKTSLYFLQHGIKLSSVKTSENLETTKQKVLHIIEKIEEAEKNNKFEPIVGPLCDWCGFQKNCPMFSHKFKEKSAAQEEIDIQKILRRFFELKEQESELAKETAEMKEKINQYCDAQKIERIFGDDGGSIVRSTQKRFDYNWNTVSEILKKAGKWEEVFAPDKSKLEEILPALSPSDFMEIEKTKKIGKEWKVLRIEKG
ncbi:MAG: PD-(D/E)XK nuclease family protein [bacterium]